MKKINILALSLISFSLLACGETPEVKNQKVDSKSVAIQKESNLDKITGEVFIKNLRDKTLTPWKGKEASLVLEVIPEKAVGKGKIDKNGHMSLNIDPKAKIEAIPFKEMFGGDHKSVLVSRLQKQNASDEPEYTCDFTKLKLSDSNLKVHDGQVVTSNNLMIEGIQDPVKKVNNDYLINLLYADRKASVDGKVTCTLTVEKEKITHVQQFSLKLNKGWNFLSHKLSIHGPDNSVYKNITQPRSWMAVDWEQVELPE